MNVLSLCDGMSCGQIALKELGIPVDTYYASEIDKNAIKVTQENFPNTIQLGDVVALKNNKAFLKSLPKIDLVMFGFPCRSLSMATCGNKGRDGKAHKGLDGISGIFFDCYEILQYIKKHNNKKVKFLIENVNSNLKDDIQAISDYIGVEPIMLDSAMFSAQSRKRLYWTNIPIAYYPTKESPLVLKDILETGTVEEKYFYNGVGFDFYGEDKKVCATIHLNGNDILKRVNSKNFKAPTLTSCRGGNLQKKVYDNGRVRKLTPKEYMRLQTIPDWYKMNVADSHIYNMCGDGWNVETIKYIFKGLKGDFHG